MSIDLTLHLVIAGLLATAGILLGSYLSRWLLQLYYHRSLLNHNRFLKHYERFASQRAYDLLTTTVVSGLPQTYEAYVVLHNWCRRLAYLYFVRHLLIIACFSLIILFVFGAIPANLARSYQLLYLAFPATITFHLFYGILIKRQRQRFYFMLTMGSVLKKLNPLR